MLKQGLFFGSILCTQGQPMGSWGFSFLYYSHRRNTGHITNASLLRGSGAPNVISHTHEAHDFPLSHHPSCVCLSHLDIFIYSNANTISDFPEMISGHGN